MSAKIIGKNLQVILPVHLKQLVLGTNALRNRRICPSVAAGSYNKDSSGRRRGHLKMASPKDVKIPTNELSSPNTSPKDPNVQALTTPATPSVAPYYFEGGFRRVRPYYFTYNTYCKERWRGKTIFEVYGTEFRDRTEEYYKQTILEGAIFVNGKPATGLDHVLRNGDVISHTLHRHEPPVTDKPVSVIFENDELMVINKPAGMPVHPAGRYHFNCVVEVLRSERGGWNPMPCNRLDRLTSGLMFIGKTKTACNDMMNRLRTRTVRKEYLALVKGEFPSEEITCDQPMLTISPKLGLNQVRANGKHAKTIFQRLSYDASKDCSVVRCLPLTGRTHQIRVHLQFLGHPVANDPIYCNRKVFGPDLGKGGLSNDEDIITRLSRMGKDEVAEAIAYHQELVTDYEKSRAERLSDEFCNVCGTQLYTDPGFHELGIYLHAWKYECAEGNWKYESAHPEWAKLETLATET